jgi:hypothetical protein
MAGNSDDDLRNALMGLGLVGRPRPTGLGAAFLTAFDSPASNPPAPSGLGLLFAGTESARRRAEWNARFEYWEKPATVSEEGRIDRAWNNVAVALQASSWLTNEGVEIRPQGSYHNNTNVRTEADIDLRAGHRSLKIEYHENVLRQCADSVLAYSDYGLTFSQIFTGLRTELTQYLSDAFGRGNIVPGTKAVRVKGITGSRAEVDVVPTIRYHYVRWLDHFSRYDVVEGVAILSTDGRWTVNFPEQHNLNGITKRSLTSHRFKKIVRIFKRMRADLAERGLLSVSVPSFLVECLVYNVEDNYFLVEDDDRYERVRRVALRMQALLANEEWAARMMEINGVKWLFHPEQAWTYSAALTFANAVVAHLGDA